ncbi:hypothetical protein [Streptomyces wuyuanensis]|uniref:Uncharacterized protein n=1 Tax=Streptomyces wuyuanensis TaxID=1196353 RepID=A0A1G9ZAP5_9ACTN|nr:hypothetical protein [Streptomyces wuyuanensis]SDN17891.1 hypothetical protein SAMN05444921_12128 [Streptomyces wuyuanensis]
MAIKRCRAAFAVSVNGVPRMVTVGQLVDASDPVIKGREALFEDVDTYVSERAPKVEQATADPGEKRSVGRPAAKKTATPVKKAAAKPEVKHEPKDDSSKEGTP